MQKKKVLVGVGTTRASGRFSSKQQRAIRISRTVWSLAGTLITGMPFSWFSRRSCGPPLIRTAGNSGERFTNAFASLMRTAGNDVWLGL
jgi:hypothetical protein